MPAKSTVFVLALAAVLAVNYPANALPIAGRRTGEMSDLFPNLFTPAGFTFAIWGLVGLGIIYRLIKRN